LQTFRSVPPISLIPMAMLFFGIGDTPAIVLIFLSGLWPLLLNTIFGVRGIERTMLKVATVRTPAKSRHRGRVGFRLPVNKTVRQVRRKCRSGWGLTVVGPQ
jgi:NitT/TauT family transport system permease protein